MALPHAPSGQVISILPLGAQLPHSSTSAILKATQLEVIRVVLSAGQALRQHHVPGEITLQCLEGAVELQTPSHTAVLRSGDFVHLQAGVPHTLLAQEDASLLLTLCILKNESQTEQCMAPFA